MKHYLQAAVLGGTLAFSGLLMAQNLAKSEQAFMRQAAQNGYAELGSSKLAQDKATDAQVKTFAQRMVEDHTLAEAELKSLASAKNVELPDEPSATQKRRHDALSRLEGAAFDRRYVQQMGVQAHRDNIALYRKAAANARDADVKAFADKQLPILEKHLEMARELEKSLGK